MACLADRIMQSKEVNAVRARQLRKADAKSLQIVERDSIESGKQLLSFSNQKPFRIMNNLLAASAPCKAMLRRL